MPNQIFQKFTNLYELSKTLRFELKPIGRTKKTLEESKVFEVDEKIAQNYKEAKKWFDRLHQEFIDVSLDRTNLSMDLYKDFEKKYFLWKSNKIKTNLVELEKSAKKLRIAILEQFNKTAEEWRDAYVRKIKERRKQQKIKKLEGLDLLFKVEVFDFLKNKYPEAVIDGKSIFNPFNKFSGYFSKFHETRKNFYKDDGKTGRIPTRIVKDNIQKFLDNKKIFEERYKEKYNSIFGGEEKIFDFEYFNQCFTQKQIDDYNDKIASLKTKINKLRQNNLEIKKADLPFFKNLFKQILGLSKKHETEQDDFIEIVNDEDVFPVLQKFIEENRKYIPKAKGLFDKFIQIQKQRTNDFEIKEIYVAGRFLNTISNKWFASWNTIRNILLKKGQKKLPDFISIDAIKKALEQSQNEVEAEELFLEDYEAVYSSESDFYQIFIRIWEQEFNKNLENYKIETKNIEKMIKEDGKYKPNKKGILKNGEEGSIQKEQMLDYANSTLAVYQMIKYFSLERGKEREWNLEGLAEDSAFYNNFNDYYQNVNTWKYFSEFRNYLTKKPYSEEKIKLNFDCEQLLGGWDKNKEKEKLGIIFKKGSLFYLGIINQGEEKDIFDEKKHPEIFTESSDFQKMEYKCLGDTKRQIPRIAFSEKARNGGEDFKPDDEIISIKEEWDQLQKAKGEDRKNWDKKFDKVKIAKLILYYQKVLEKHSEKYKEVYGLNFKKLSDYKKLGDFFEDMKKQFYKLKFVGIDKNYIDEKVANRELYLFQIYNKDFELDENIVPNNYVYKGREGKKNIHTTYWKALFSENLEKTILKLNGQAEIFFRKGTLKPEIDEKRRTKRKVVRYKRYTEDKILFHCPIALNFTKDDKAINERLRKEILVNNPNINIIGIDRGEKNLAYYSVINQKGEILDLGSFNKIQEREDKEPTDYQQKLDKIEKDRDWQRKSWQEITNIKEMKQGYISQVVKKICDLVIKYNAIVVFEDLNIGFKRGRFAIEKQIYQNLELALAKKLNYLVFKDAKEGEAGHYLRAYQLTPLIDNFQDIKKQCGIMFYVPASYTSAICPICGFRKNISTPVAKLDKNKELLGKFQIFYEVEKDRFKISYKKNDFYKNDNDEDKNRIQLFENIESKNDFVFHSNVERLKYQRSKDNRGGKVEERDPNKELKELFNSNQINFEVDPDISTQIKRRELENESFYKKLIYLLAIIMQLRNTKVVKNEDGTINEEKTRDFIACSACYFHSENNLLGFERKYLGGNRFKFNGDANGAYNIARKGSLILQKFDKIKKVKGSLDNVDYNDLTVTQGEFDKFAQTSKTSS